MLTFPDRSKESKKEEEPPVLGDDEPVGVGSEPVPASPLASPLDSPLTSLLTSPASIDRTVNDMGNEVEEFVLSDPDTKGLAINEYILNLAIRKAIPRRRFFQRP